MQKTSNAIKGCLMAALASTALPAVALAQEAAGEATDAVATGDEIVVTAQKRSESIDRVPITINAVSQETLDRQGVKNIADLARTTPGLTFRTADTFDNPTLAIRGILSTVGSATTGVYLDETPITARSICFYCGSSAFPQLFDLERVEVLKGPQGTLFGAGSEGGTVRFITPQPSLTDFTGYGRAELAATRFADPSYEAGLAIGGPIVRDQLGFRVSGWHRKEGGYIDRIDRFTGVTLNEDVNDLEATVVRAALAAKPNERLTITPSFFFQRTETSGRSLYKLPLGGFRSDRLIEEPGSDRQLLGSLNVSYEGDAVTLTSVTSYYDRGQYRQDDYSELYALIFSAFSPVGPVETIPGYTVQNEVATSQSNWTQEVRLSSNGDGPLNWTIGGYYANNRSRLVQGIRQDLSILTNFLFFSPVVDIFGVDQEGPFSYQGNQLEVERELAAFGQATYSITDELSISAGARIANTRYNATILRGGVEASPGIDQRTTLSQTPILPKFVVSYQAGPTLIYASAAKGFRIGGSNSSVKDSPIAQQDLLLLGIDDIPLTYSSDSVWSYEIGVKTRFANGRGRISASVFQIDWNNIQTSVILPISFSDYIDNVGSARSRGVELQATFEPIDGLNLYGLLGYTDAQYLEDRFVIPGDPTSARAIAAGQTLPISKWAASAGAEYEFPLSGSLDAYARGDYQYSSRVVRSVPGNLGYDALIATSPEQNLMAVRAGVRFDEIDLSLFVNNLFDARTVAFIQRDNSLSDQIRQSIVRPRTVGATATMRF